MVRFTNSSAGSAALSDPDVELMLRVRDGDNEAFAELFARYNDRVQGVITYLMGNAGATEDLTQEVFMRVHRARRNYIASAKFSTWLFTIVNNVVLNARRTLSRRREVSVLVEDHDGFSSEGPRSVDDTNSPEGVAQRNEVRQLVLERIGRLGHRQREAVSMCDLAGLSYADVADELGTTPDAAKSLIHRGRTSLRRLLEPQVHAGNLL